MAGLAVAMLLLVSLSPTSTPFDVSPVEAASVLAFACQADPLPVSHDDRVVWREQMPADALGLGSIASGQPFAPEDIDSDRDGFEMGRIHTATISTQMVKSQSPRYLAHERFIGEAVRINVLALEPVLAVSVAPVRPPIPAARAPADSELDAEAFGEARKVHLVLPRLGERPNGGLDDGCLRESEMLRESRDEPDALWREPVAGSEFLRHVGNVPLAAVGVN